MEEVKIHPLEDLNHDEELSSEIDVEVHMPQIEETNTMNDRDEEEVVRENEVAITETNLLENPQRSSDYEAISFKNDSKSSDEEEEEKESKDSEEKIVETDQKIKKDYQTDSKYECESMLSSNSSHSKNSKNEMEDEEEEEEDLSPYVYMALKKSSDNDRI